MKRVSYILIYIYFLIACKTNDNIRPRIEKCIISSYSLELPNPSNQPYNYLNFNLPGIYFYNAKGYIDYVHLNNKFNNNLKNHYFYDDNDFLIKIKASSSVYTDTLTFEYNTQGLLSKITVPGSEITNIYYDSNNRISKIKIEQVHTISGFKPYFEYNYSDGKISSLVSYNLLRNFRTDYTTNKDGFITKEQTGLESKYYNYDSNNNLIQVQTYGNGELFNSINYTYDKKKNPFRTFPQFKGINFPIDTREIIRTSPKKSPNNVVTEELRYNNLLISKVEYVYKYNTDGFPIYKQATTTYLNSLNNRTEIGVKEEYTYDCK